MDGRGKNNNAFLFHFLLIVHDLDHVILLPIVLPVFVVDQISISFIEIERIDGPFGRHLLVLDRKIHLCWIFLVTALFFLLHDRPGGAILGEGRVAQQLMCKLF